MKSLADPDEEIAATQSIIATPPSDQSLELCINDVEGTTIHPVAHRTRLVLGRSLTCDVPLRDNAVSRTHVRLRFTHPMAVEDAGSRHGTRVDGTLVPPGGEAPLHVGSVISIGATTIMLRVARVALSRPASTSGAREGDPIVVAPEMVRLYEMLSDIAPSRVAVLILGETGVGKEHYARAVHDRSTRRDKSYVQINCAALHDTLLEAELFGYERGAFTGAVQAKPGLFEAAAGGTVFLDEVGEMSLPVQAKLLRVLENGSVQRLGSVKTMHVDVRIVSATNRDLKRAVTAGTFRADLFYRLNGISLTLPPLRRRAEDIGALSAHFAEGFAKQFGRPPVEITASALTALQRHDWPGNVRELRSVIERSLLLLKQPYLTAESLQFGDDGALDAPPSEHTAAMRAEVPLVREDAPAPETSPGNMRRDIEDLERARVEKALAETQGNQSRAARLLGISRNTLISRIEKFGLARPRKA